MKNRSTYISRQRLARLLCPLAREFKIEIVNETGSTNADLIERWRKARNLLNAHSTNDADIAAVRSVYEQVFAQPSVRVAYSQTAGCGRRGRVWLAPAGSALLFSIAYLIPRALSGLAGLSLATGVAIIEGLRALPLVDPHRLSLKWPNDVLLDHAKLAGTLIETAWHTAQSCAVVIGIGINLDHENILTAQLARLNTFSTPHLVASRYRPAGLARLLPEAAITRIFASVLNALAGMLKRFSAEGFAPFCDVWNADHSYNDRSVVLMEHGEETVRGTAIGVDALGHLLIDTSCSGGGVKQMASGDLSLRCCYPAPASC